MRRGYLKSFLTIKQLKPSLDKASADKPGAKGAKIIH